MNNAPFRPNSVSVPNSNSENIFLRLKFLPFLNLNKTEHPAKVSSCYNSNKHKKIQKHLLVRQAIATNLIDSKQRSCCIKKDLLHEHYTDRSLQQRQKNRCSQQPSIINIYQEISCKGLSHFPFPKHTFLLYY